MIKAYHDASYWDRLYKDMSSDDVHEWGGFDMQSGLMQLQYERMLHYTNGINQIKEYENENESGSVHTASFAECMDVNQYNTPEQAIEQYQENQSNNINESIILLGCGNSKVGEQLMINSFVGPVLQLDISSKIIHLMTQRYEKYLTKTSVQRMEFIVDDAKDLTSLSPDSIGGGVLDKGLIDVLHCSSGMMHDNEGDTNPIRQIMNSVHRVLQPSRPFIFFSRSEPEYIFKRTLGTVQIELDMEIERKWKDIQVLKLVDLDILLYRFVKAEQPLQKQKRKSHPFSRST